MPLSDLEKRHREAVIGSERKTTGNSVVLTQVINFMHPIFTWYRYHRSGLIGALGSPGLFYFIYLGFSFKISNKTFDLIAFPML